MLENTADTFYTAIATDPQDDPVTLSIWSGADASLFVLNGDGELRFDTPANFEMPADDNADNVYEVTLRATAGGENVDLDLRVSVTNDREGVSIVRIATGFVDPIALAGTGSDRELIVGERSGVAHFVDGRSGSRRPVPAMDPIADGELLDIAFGTSGLFAGPLAMQRRGENIELYRPSVTNSRNRKILANGPKAVNTTGTVYFNHNGVMFGAVGDPIGGDAQTAGGFGMLFTQGNPYASASLDYLPLRKLGVGVQSPRGMARYLDDFLFLLDAGSSQEHEVSLFLQDQDPLNFGWPFIEGTVELEAGAPADVIEPVIAYPWDSEAPGNDAPVAGVLYEAPEPASLSQRFLFVTSGGALWSAPISMLTDGDVDDLEGFENRRLDFEPVDGSSLDEIVDIGLDLNGWLYILDADGDLFRLDLD